MLKLYAIIIYVPFVLSSPPEDFIASVIGPYDSSIEKCQFQMNEWQTQFDEGQARKLRLGETLNGTIKFTCQYREKEPSIGDKP